MSEPRVREAQPADVADVFRLVRGLADYEGMLDRFSATEADFSRLLFGPRTHARALLAEIDGAAIGVALWYFSLSTFRARPVLFLEDIFVDPAARRRGVGLALFRHLARIAQQEDCWSMDWNVLTWNQPAIDFYRTLGAQPVTEWMVQRLDQAALQALAAG